MRYVLLFMLMPFMCMAQYKNTVKTDSLNGKPAYYYLNHEDIDDISKAFYSGQFSIGDNEETRGLIDAIFTDNGETRAFYIYNFNRLLAIADKTTAEDAGMEAKDFIEKNPCDFFAYLNDKHFKIITTNWVKQIGFAMGTQKVLNKWISDIEPVILKSCKQYLADWNDFKAQLAKEIS